MPIPASAFRRRTVGLVLMFLGGFAFVFAFVFAFYFPSLTWTAMIMTFGAVLFFMGLYHRLNPVRGRRRRLIR